MNWLLIFDLRNTSQVCDKLFLNANVHALNRVRHKLIGVFKQFERHRGIVPVRFRLSAPGRKFLKMSSIFCQILDVSTFFC